jgi:ParB-like chromosome segregation protein Spo0J
MRNEEKQEVGSRMSKYLNKVKEVDVSSVKGNKALAAGVCQRAVGRCKDAAEELGVVHTPVVGTTKSGERLLLSGQCELTALRELGVKKMEVIEVLVSDDGGAKAKLSLRLMTLRERPGALCEGQLLQEAVSAGIPRAEIQTILGKSASWVSNRLSLVTRLDKNVYEMVRNGLIDPRSAQEIARLPAELQFAFAQTSITEGLPKSAIETLVAGYRDESCHDTVKAQILIDPRAALKRMLDKRRAVNAGRLNRQKNDTPLGVIEGCINAAKPYIATLSRLLFSEPPHKLNDYKHTLKDLEADLSTLLNIVRDVVYPGKMEGDHNAG